MPRKPTEPTESLGQQDPAVSPREERTARLSVLIDPNKKAAFEAICRQEDVTPSQVVRQLIRDFIESRLGADWRAQVLRSDSLP